MKRICVAGWILSMLCLALAGCHKTPIDKQEADDIVKRYIQKHLLPCTGEYRVYYFNRLDVERLDLSFYDGENIAVENAYIYCLEDLCGSDEKTASSAKMMPPPPKTWTVVVHKQNGKYDVYRRQGIPTVEAEGIDNGGSIELWTFCMLAHGDTIEEWWSN